MKKFIVALLSVLLLFFLTVYIAIPNPIVVSSVSALHGSNNAINRTIQNKQFWRKLWRESKITSSPYFTVQDSLFYNNGGIVITKQFQNALDCKVMTDADTILSHFTVHPAGRDSVAINWEYSKSASSNPVTRIRQYYKAIAMKKYLTNALTSFTNSLTNENIYGLSIQEASTTDTLFISTSAVTKGNPATETIYNLIKTLQEYASKNNVQQTDSAIINITTSDEQNFKVMVAIPLNKRLAGDNNINQKLMIPGRFLTATVRGGNGTINTAMNQMQQYFFDYQRTAMAIPFQKLLINRELETDTSKWMTRLYFPVM